MMVSLVVPAWNAERSIGRALRSVLADRDLAVECLVVDDGSTDGTAVAIERAAATDPRIALLRAPANEGVSSARNRALAKASGEWLAFLDADDVLCPGALRRMLDAARSSEALAVVGQRIWTDGRRRWQAAAYRRPDILRPGRKSLVTHPGLLYYASATGKLFHRSLVEGLRFEGRVLGDQPWTIRALIRAGDRIQVIDDVVYEWIRPRSRQESSTITAAKYGSARLAAEAARVAISALAEVAGEAELRIADPAARDLVVAGYLDRIASSDLSGAVARGVARGDDGTDGLFQAIGEFLDSAPAALVDRSTAVARDVLRPPIDRWPSLRGPARSAFVRLLRQQLRRHPGLEVRLSRFGPVSLGVALLVRSGDGPVPRLADACFVAAWPLGLGRRAARLARVGVARLRASGARYARSAP